MQLQMYVTGRNVSDFCVWSPRGYHLERISRKYSLIKVLVGSADSFFLQIYPQKELKTVRLLTRRIYIYIYINAANNIEESQL